MRGVLVRTPRDIISGGGISVVAILARISIIAIILIISIIAIFFIVAGVVGVPSDFSVGISVGVSIVRIPWGISGRVSVGVSTGISGIAIVAVVPGPGVAVIVRIFAVSVRHGFVGNKIYYDYIMYRLYDLMYSLQKYRPKIKGQ